MIDEIRDSVPADELDGLQILIKQVDRGGYPEYLLQDDQGMRGWLRDGENWRDIRWREQYVDGWPKSVAMPADPVSKFD